MGNEKSNAIKMKPPVGKRLLYTLGTLWIALVFSGMYILWNYETLPGKSAEPPLDWPENSFIDQPHGENTMILFAHPRCPCTRASMGELNRLITLVKDLVRVYVIFYRPKTAEDSWAYSDLWRLANTIPNVEARIDPDGRLTRIFGVSTSGHVLLYDSDGRLAFNGGITVSRGHHGDNPGRSAILSILLKQNRSGNRSEVFGCVINDPECEKQVGDL